ncbi:MFS transporter, partial [Mycobacterium marinum]
PGCQRGWARTTHRRWHRQQTEWSPVFDARPIS